MLAYGADLVGVGQRLHAHPYDESFAVIAGRGRFFVGGTTIDTSAGEIALGPDRLQTIDINPSPE